MNLSTSLFIESSQTGEKILEGSVLLASFFVKLSWLSTVIQPDYKKM